VNDKAMNLTFGDLIIVEIALVHYVKELDLSMQSGQYISELLGKVEYKLSQIRASASPSTVPDLNNPPMPPPGPR